LVAAGVRNTWGVALPDGVVSMEAMARSRTNLEVDIVVTSPRTNLNRTILTGGERVVVGTDVDAQGLNVGVARDGTSVVLEMARNHNEKKTVAVNGGI